MTTPPVRVERRVGQRFPYLLPVSLRACSAELEGLGFTQDLSSRGVFLFTDAPVGVGAEIELTLKMPSEITLGESMRVRCRGRVLRVVRPSAPLHHGSSDGTLAETKIGVAVRFERYEYLTESAESAAAVRVSAIHSPPEENKPLTAFSARAVQG
jgi:hypothetical protein